MFVFTRTGGGRRPLRAASCTSRFSDDEPTVFDHRSWRCRAMLSMLDLQTGQLLFSNWTIALPAGSPLDRRSQEWTPTTYGIRSLVFSLFFSLLSGVHKLRIIPYGLAFVALGMERTRRFMLFLMHDSSLWMTPLLAVWTRCQDFLLAHALYLDRLRPYSIEARSVTHTTWISAADLYGHPANLSAGRTAAVSEHPARDCVHISNLQILGSMRYNSLNRRFFGCRK